MVSGAHASDPPPRVERRPIANDDLVGTLFLPPPKERRGAAVMVLGGSRGGVEEHGAAMLAQAGFTALALAYFGTGRLPPSLIEVPVELVTRAIDWLRSQPEVDSQRVGIMGRSKGGELALVAASHDPDRIGAVVAYSPSPIVWQGLPADRRGWRAPPRSSWTIDGRPLPFLAFAKPRLRDLPRTVGSMVTGRLALRPVHEAALANEQARDSALAPLERISGPVMLISGTDDQLWPSTALCDLAVERLARREHASADQHLSYPGAGHLVGVPGNRPPESRRFDVGGTPERDAQASADAWPQAIAFLSRHL